MQRGTPVLYHYELILISQIGRLENVIGWYHSHPGYGCWLSGIDVATQSMNQNFQDPFLALVVDIFSSSNFDWSTQVDPNRTVAAGKVEIGAFRTYPENYKPPKSSSEYQPIPLDKIEDFGAHADRYYQLDISFFKSTVDETVLDALWNQYWINTLHSSPLLSVCPLDCD